MREGSREAVWDRPPGKRPVLTSIAAAEEDVFVADAGALVVWHYDLDGKLLGQHRQARPGSRHPRLRRAQPVFRRGRGPRRTVAGGQSRARIASRPTPSTATWKLSWGKRGLGVEAFCGCCNPSNIAILRRRAGRDRRERAFRG